MLDALDAIRAEPARLGALGPGIQRVRGLRSVRDVDVARFNSTLLNLVGEADAMPRSPRRRGPSASACACGRRPYRDPSANDLQTSPEALRLRPPASTQRRSSTTSSTSCGCRHEGRSLRSAAGPARPHCPSRIAASSHCVELDGELAAETRRKLGAFPAVEIITAPFEMREPAVVGFAAVAAFTAFHWIDPRLHSQTVTRGRSRACRAPRRTGRFRRSR